MGENSNVQKPVIFVGAADAICGEAIKIFAKATDRPIVLLDANQNSLRDVAAKLPGRDVTTGAVDIFNPEELRAAIADAGLVIQGAQPYQRTSELVITACIDAKVPYLDYSDDVHSTQVSLSLHERAKHAGIPCYINCGSSPGMTNLLAAEISQELDNAESIDICWLVSEEGGELGREVLEHVMDITGGPCLTWADGKATVHENWVETSHAPLAGGSNQLFYESIHPEPVTLPRRFPNVGRIRTLGALNPAPFNGLARGLGAAVSSGALSMDAAVDFLQHIQSKPFASWSDIFSAVAAQFQNGNITLNQLYQLASHSVSSLKPANFALWGMVGQVRNGQCTTGEALGFLLNSMRGKKAPPHSGMLVRGVGTRNGHPAVVIKRTRNLQKDSPLGQSMATSIGASCAAFALLALDHEEQGRVGVYCPEDWAEPDAFFKCMEKLGCPRDQIIESV
ncbi:hypothetical protein N7497_010539 [Penicillium chrysogenum]|mgnify:FL=1|jgi:saccharopine dehydrogenase-like NADP-dependent oxidoreductase|uniref:Saccharopine dehydrogenase NADP binding domain-containing protein n=1 Tax=Penicillium chrysogenum TaxID=5076 RepID=A0ABQ8WF86_PENCH|nr:hypothetical protein N7505_004491 [Penicillium chrysogenum]KAJ6148557.1 hypothetical protein N7497_010539 [Penicillium chrysogenum]